VAPGGIDPAWPSEDQPAPNLPSESGVSADAGGGPLTAVRTQLAKDVTQLDREIEEVGLLARQAATEVTRQDARRAKAEERVTALEADPHANPDELREARVQLVTLTRRTSLFDGQKDALNGKHQLLQRLRDRLTTVENELAELDPSDLVAPLGRQARSAAGGTGPGKPADAAAAMRALEDMRRDIARQMHDGPAQSLANIALQSEIVERLVGRGDPRATNELAQMRRMVQGTLAQTKDFIFDIRPMVLDDLGLVPTLRRMAVDRGQRDGVEIDLDSYGADRRLPPDLESGVFRLLDGAIVGYVRQRPDRVSVRLEWSEKELTASVRATWSGDAAADRNRQPAEQPEARSELPPALAAMIAEAEHAERTATAQSRSLPPDRLRDIQDRAEALGAVLAVSEDGQGLEIALHLT
jgi:two-component system, NarL family, sensor histidine kinase DegS